MENKNITQKTSFGHILQISGEATDIEAFVKDNPIIEEDGEVTLNPFVSEENVQILNESVNGAYYKWLSIFLEAYFIGVEDLEKNIFNYVQLEIESAEDYQAFNEIMQHWIHYLSPQALPKEKILEDTPLVSSNLEQKYLVFSVGDDSIANSGIEVLHMATNWTGLKVKHGICLPDGRMLEFVYENNMTKRFLTTNFEGPKGTKVRMMP